ncbi:MAG: hypothetical protein R2705_25315 [Ilumatobacteraceae bacterium]
MTPTASPRSRPSGGSALASDSFSPVYLRNATAYGYASRMRGDLVVNNLTGYAITTGEVFMKSDARRGVRSSTPRTSPKRCGSRWRPLAKLVHAEAFNVGGNVENYQVRDVAKIVEEVVDGSDRAGRVGRPGPPELPGGLHQDRRTSRLRAEVDRADGRRAARRAVPGHRITKEQLEGPNTQRVLESKSSSRPAASTSSTGWSARRHPDRPRCGPSAGGQEPLSSSRTLNAPTTSMISWTTMKARTAPSRDGRLGEDIMNSLV